MLQRFQLNQKVFGNPNNIPDTIIPVDTSYMAGWYCNMHASQQRKTIDFISSAACIGPSSTMEDSQQGANF